MHRVSSMENGHFGKDIPAAAAPKPPRRFHLKALFLLLAFLVLGVGFSFFSIHMTKYFRMRNFVAMTKNSFSSWAEERPLGLDHWVRPPVNLIHAMRDDELLWAASLLPQVTKYPYKRKPKIAFMFLTRGPLPLFPLWEKFLSGYEGLYSIYIHSLPSYEAKYPPESPFYKRQIPSKVTEWGEMSMCDAERRLVANALLDFSNEWFVLLSESCIPLFNFSIIYDYLKRSPYSYVNSFDEHGPYGRGRYNLSMSPAINISDWRKGSQWFEANRRVAVAIVKDTKYYPLFKKFCRPHCYVDEHYFPTMLSIELPHLLANRSLTWVDWSRGGAHPATFGMADITETFLKRVVQGNPCDYNGRVTMICNLFARKFAPSALQPLLYLAPKVLGYG